MCVPSYDAFMPKFRDATKACVPDRASGQPNAAGVTCTMPNGVVFQEGGGLEIAGATEFVASMLLQSISAHDGSGESYITLFKAWNASQDAHFTNLRAKGAFLVSASLVGGAVASPITVDSEAGQPVVQGGASRQQLTFLDLLCSRRRK